MPTRQKEVLDFYSEEDKSQEENEGEKASQNVADSREQPSSLTRQLSPENP